MKKLILFLLFIFLSSSAWADFQVATGTLTTPTSTGNASISGLAFTPKVVIIYGNIITTRGYNFGIGAASGSSSEWGSSVWDDNNQAPERNLKTTEVVSIYNSTTDWLEGNLVSLDSTGFTVDWTTVQASGKTLYYIAMGGSSLSASVGNFTSSASTGTQSITGLGFQPSTVLLDTIGLATAGPSGTDILTLGIGDAGSTHTTAGNNVVASGNSYYQQLSGTIISRVSSSGPSQTAVATLTSLDSGGFTLNFTTAASYLYGYIALGGIQSAQGVFNQPSSNGNQSVTGLSFSPSVVMFMNAQAISGTSIGNGRGLNFGIGLSSSNMNFGTLIAASGTNNYGGDAGSGEVIENMSGGNPSTVNAKASMFSLDSAGFTVDWTQTNATAVETIYWALGTASAPSTNSTIYLGSSTRNIYGATIR